MDTDRIRLNRKVYLAYKDYRHNIPEFLDNLFAPEIKGEKNNKKKDEKKKGGKKTKRAKSGKGSKEKKGKKGKKPKNASKKNKKATKKKTKASKTSKASKKSSNLTDVESGSGDGSTVQCDVVEEPRQRVKLIHIGSSFEEAMKTVECLKVSLLVTVEVARITVRFKIYLFFFS